MMIMYYKLRHNKCLYFISKQAEKETIEVGSKLKVLYRSEVYIAKVKFDFELLFHIMCVYIYCVFFITFYRMINI